MLTELAHPDLYSVQFEVFRNGKLVALTPGTSYFDETIVPGQTYHFAVRAVTGLEVSETVSLRIATDGGEINDAVPGVTPNSLPSTPENLRATSTENTLIVLAWDEAVDGDGQVVAYEIFRNAQRIATTETAAYRDTFVQPGSSYRYSVAAVDNDGESGRPARAVLTSSGVNTENLTAGGGVLPADCLVTDGGGLYYCYQSASRELTAFTSEGAIYWSFTLPGMTESNDVRHVEFANKHLVVVAKTVNDQWEYSLFNPEGEFRGTRNLHRLPSSADDDVLLSVAGDSHGLLLAYRGENGTIVERVELRSGLAVAAASLPAGLEVRLSLPQAPDGNSIVSGVLVEIDGVEHTLDGLLLDNTAFRQLPDGVITDGNREAVRALVNYLAAGGPVETGVSASGAGQSSERDLLIDSDSENRSIFQCADGGQYTELSPAGRSFVISHYLYEDCRHDDRVLNGERRSTRVYSGHRTGGSTISTITYSDYQVDYDNGDSVLLNGRRVASSSFSFATICSGNNSRSTTLAFDSASLIVGGDRMQLGGTNYTSSRFDDPKLYPDDSGGLFCDSFVQRYRSGTILISYARSLNESGATVTVEISEEQSFGTEPTVTVSGSRSVIATDDSRLVDEAILARADAYRTIISNANGTRAIEEAGSL